MAAICGPHRLFKSGPARDGQRKIELGQLAGKVGFELVGRLQEDRRRIDRDRLPADTGEVHRRDLASLGGDAERPDRRRHLNPLHASSLPRTSDRSPHSSKIRTIMDYLSPWVGRDSS